MRTRNEALAALVSGTTGDILIVGGGINGVGLYRDLAAQGVATTLVEMGDFCSGTSSAPSRLIHGGLRYLEQGEFKLVKESVEERDRLLVNAPHQVRPIRVWVPALSWTAGTFQAALRFFGLVKNPGPKGALILKLGLTFFDGFSRRYGSMPHHRLVSRHKALETVSGLAASTKIVAEYYDARIESPERLTMELVADTEAACEGCVALPYMKLTGIEGNRASLKDLLTGEEHSREFRLIINCAGVWIDKVDHSLKVEEELVGGTRGSHLLLKRPDLVRELGDVMLYFETPDHRACLIYARDKDHILLGTTDLRTENIDDKETTEEEIDYLFDVMRTVLPGSNPARTDISFAYSGVRPLPRQTGGAAGSISRDHTFRMFEPSGSRKVPVLTLIGGKWTTYRACAEQLADLALKRIGIARKTDTAHLAIGGGKAFPVSEDARTDFLNRLTRSAPVSLSRAEVLLRRYGSRAADFANTLLEAGDQETPLLAAPCYSREEILWIARNERVSRLEDVILRRTLMGFEGWANAQSVREVAETIAPVLDWSAETAEAEIRSVLGLLSVRHRVPPDGSTAS
ncbi:glycerol-3-phosphate dehydrogenase/oxidase [Roseibium suaedae]|uniref:Glycerol-3-phosphate dehydrogenase n=1 Tax=Roseibium suaedae TaxID=735517 RepID=A0A1M7LF89_9HYPH|nr:glycerol-3-phosphate dehydrogenase/oxidase [Roseibium suaedae]SHM76807.1 glycerol-3-phosphate dehydrogenase [Roseibium suaedae]